MMPSSRRSRRAVHEPGLGRFASERERRQGLGPEVDGEDLEHGEREWDPSAAERVEEERHDLGRRVHEDVEDELADVVVDSASFAHCGDDAREVVVGEDHRCRVAGDIGARTPHRDADIGAT